GISEVQPLDFSVLGPWKGGRPFRDRQLKTLPSGSDGQVFWKPLQSGLAKRNLGEQHTKELVLFRMRRQTRAAVKEEQTPGARQSDFPNEREPAQVDLRNKRQWTVLRGWPVDSARKIRTPAE